MIAASGVATGRMELVEPRRVLCGLVVRQASLLTSSIALLLLSPRAKTTECFAGFLLLDCPMRYVDGWAWDTPLHEQAKAGGVGEFLERGG